MSATAERVSTRPTGAWAAAVKGLGRVVREPLGLVGLILVALVIVSAIGADWFAPYDATEINVRDRMLGPSLDHLASDADERDEYAVDEPGCSEQEHRRLDA